MFSFKLVSCDSQIVYNIFHRSTTLVALECITMIARMAIARKHTLHKLLP